MTVNTDGAIITLDTDGSGFVDFDTEVTIFDAAGNILANNDDSNISNGGGGSTSGLDSFLTFTTPQPGTYFIAIGLFSSSDTLRNVPECDSYQLHVSVTEPANNPNVVGNPSESDDVANGGDGNDIIHGLFGDDVLRLCQVNTEKRVWLSWLF